MNEMKQDPLTGTPQAVDDSTVEVAATAAGPRLPKRMLRLALLLIVPLIRAAARLDPDSVITIPSTS